MTPIQAIKDWYVSLDDELQSDIAYMFVFLTLGDRQFAPAAAVRRLLQWFDACSAGTEHEDALAAVMFRASFEYIFAGRFTGAGWIFPEQMFKDVIREAAEGKEASKIATSAFQLLRNFPDRKTKWKEAGKNWNALVNSALNDDALRPWTQDQFLVSDFGPTQD
ncbi:putative NAD(P)/FAD-binding protein YdhS [Bradyrhizobium sp. GM24.11]